MWTVCKNIWRGINDRRKKTKFKQIKYRYFKYRILSSLTFGKLKEKYKEKRIKNKELYTYLKKYVTLKVKEEIKWICL